MKVAVTGGNGFLGSEITRQARMSGLDVVQLSRQQCKIDCGVQLRVVDFDHSGSIGEKSNRIR